MEINLLLRKGYFPEELIPALNSNLLSDAYSHPNSKIFAFFKEDKEIISKHVPFSIPRHNSYRRNLSIPNPRNYIRLSKIICNNWRNIVQITEGSKFSLTRLDIEQQGVRSLVSPDFDKIIEEKILRSAGCRYVLKTDIQRFYGSVYTHSIAWAIHGKLNAKDRRRDRTLFGNSIDLESRNMQDGQTIGIPIGTDSSRVISELIASRIDVGFSNKFTQVKAVRVIDDYSFYFNSLSELEQGRSLLFELLKEFELELNPSKEKLIELPETNERRWYRKLRDFKFSAASERQRKDLIDFFDLTITGCREFPEDSVLPYSLAKISATVFKDSNWKLLEAFLIQSLILESRVIPYVVRLFISHAEVGYELDRVLIKTAIEKFVNFHSGLGNHFEISWAIWLLKQLEIALNSSIANKVLSTLNSTTVLVVLDMMNSGLIDGEIDLEILRIVFDADCLYKENWLLCYEALFKKWIPFKRDIIGEDHFFSLLRNQGVSFYDSSAEMDTSNVVVSMQGSSVDLFRHDQTSENNNRKMIDFDSEDLPF